MGSAAGSHVSTCGGSQHCQISMRNLPGGSPERAQRLAASPAPAAVDLDYSRAWQHGQRQRCPGAVDLARALVAGSGYSLDRRQRPCLCRLRIHAAARVQDQSATVVLRSACASACADAGSAMSGMNHGAAFFRRRHPPGRRYRVAPVTTRRTRRQAARKATARQVLQQTAEEGNVGWVFRQQTWLRRKGPAELALPHSSRSACV